METSLKDKPNSFLEILLFLIDASRKLCKNIVIFSFLDSPPGNSNFVFVETLDLRQYWYPLEKFPCMVKKNKIALFQSLLPPANSYCIVNILDILDREVKQAPLDTV